MGYNLTLLGREDRVLGKIFSENLWTGGLFKKKTKNLYMLGERGLLSTQECRKGKERKNIWRNGSKKKQNKLELCVNRLKEKPDRG